MYYIRWISCFIDKRYRESYWSHVEMMERYWMLLDRIGENRRESMKRIKVVASLIGLVVVAPIWYFIMYTVLQSIGASELTWFLFWVYVPLSLFVNLLIKVLEE